MTTEATAPVVGNANTESSASAEPAPVLAAPIINAAETPPAAAVTPPVEGEPAPAAETPPAVEAAPETYETFTVPEGLTISDEVNAQFSEVAKGLNLTQPKAQELIDLYSSLQMKAVEAQNAAVESQKAADEADFTTRLNTWAEEAKVHPEVGGANFEANMEVAGTALRKYFSPDAVKLIEDYGLLHNGEFAAGLKKIGERISEEKVVTGETPEGNKPEADTFEAMLPQPGLKAIGH